MNRETNIGSQVEACCMLCVSGFVGGGGSLGVVVGLLHANTLCCMATDHDQPACLPFACYTHASGMPDTRIHSGTRARAHLHRHCTAVLAMVSAQRSCSEVNPMEAN